MTVLALPIISVNVRMSADRGTEGPEQIIDWSLVIMLELNQTSWHLRINKGEIITIGPGINLFLHPILKVYFNCMLECNVLESGTVSKTKRFEKACNAAI